MARSPALRFFLFYLKLGVIGRWFWKNLKFPVLFRSIRSLEPNHAWLFDIQPKRLSHCPCAAAAPFISLGTAHDIIFFLVAQWERLSHQLLIYYRIIIIDCDQRAQVIVIFRLENNNKRFLSFVIVLVNKGNLFCVPNRCTWWTTIHLVGFIKRRKK